MLNLRARFRHALSVAFYRLRQERIPGRLLDSERKTAVAWEGVLTFEVRHRYILKTAMKGHCLVDMRGHAPQFLTNCRHKIPETVPVRALGLPQQKDIVDHS